VVYRQALSYFDDDGLMRGHMWYSMSSADTLLDRLQRPAGGEMLAQAAFEDKR